MRSGLKELYEDKEKPTKNNICLEEDVKEDATKSNQNKNLYVKYCMGWWDHKHRLIVCTQNVLQCDDYTVWCCSDVDILNFYRFRF